MGRQGSVSLADYHGKDALVVGLGVSGLWTARCLASCGVRVTVSELRPERDLDPSAVSELRAAGVRLDTGGHTRESFLHKDLIVVSPGVPHDLEPVAAAAAAGIPVMGELELASRLIDTPMVAVTGSNGKSTVTALLGAVLERSGLRVFVGGNIGTPLMAYAAGGTTADCVVVEVSSFQLDTADTFRPRVSVILNISPDHLDRYPGYDVYVGSKMRIYRNQGEGDVVVLNDDDPVLAAVVPPPGVRVLRYGRTEAPGRDAWLGDGAVCVRGDGAEAPGVVGLASCALAGAPQQGEPHGRGARGPGPGRAVPGRPGGGRCVPGASAPARTGGGVGGGGLLQRLQGHQRGIGGPGRRGLRPPCRAHRGRAPQGCGLRPPSSGRPGGR